MNADDDFMRRARAAARDPAQKARYEAQIRDMALRAVEWQQRRPLRPPLVRWNVPDDGRLVVEWDLAVVIQLCDLNDAGREMLEYVVEPWKGSRAAPTINMVRRALDAARGRDRERASS